MCFINHKFHVQKLPLKRRVGNAPRHWGSPWRCPVVQMCHHLLQKQNSTSSLYDPSCVRLMYSMCNPAHCISLTNQRHWDVSWLAARVYMFCLTLALVMVDILVFHFVILVNVRWACCARNRCSSGDADTQTCTIISLLGKAVLEEGSSARQMTHWSKDVSSKAKQRHARGFNVSDKTKSE